LLFKSCRCSQNKRDLMFNRRWMGVVLYCNIQNVFNVNAIHKKVGFGVFRFALIVSFLF
jgi:hypothetical protein